MSESHKLNCHLRFLHGVSRVVSHLVSLEELLVRLTLKGLSHQALEPGAVLPELPQQL